MPNFTYVQGHNPAVHILRRGLSTVGVVTWLLLGGKGLNNSEMHKLGTWKTWVASLNFSILDFLTDAVIGSGVRLEESVLTGKHSCEVLSIDTPGRIFYISRVCGVFSKNWPCRFLNHRHTS